MALYQESSSAVTTLNLTDEWQYERTSYLVWDDDGRFRMERDIEARAGDGCVERRHTGPMRYYVDNVEVPYEEFVERRRAGS